MAATDLKLVVQQRLTQAGRRDLPYVNRAVAVTACIVLPLQKRIGQSSARFRVLDETRKPDGKFPLDGRIQKHKPDLRLVIARTMPHCSEQGQKMFYFLQS